MATTKEIIEKLQKLDPIGDKQIIRWQDEGDGLLEVGENEFMLVGYHDGSIYFTSDQPKNAILVD